MPEPDDISLLKQYAGGDESAFTTLFERHVHLVYSSALRQVRNPSQAEEITQVVFILLARKAKSLSPKIVLSGWLYQAARLTASSLIKREVRRQRREQEVYMQTLTEPETSQWDQIAPLLEDAMGRLGEQDRNAIVLRFFENRTPQEVAATLKLNEVTARKRVSRAVEKLRAFFARRGVVLTAAVIAGAISGNSVQAAPAALANSATAIAIAKGAAASASTLTLVKGALKVMAWTKTKMIITGAVVTLLIGGGATIGTIETVHAIRTAFYPNIEGTWEGTMPLGGMGVNKKETTWTRIVLTLSKKSGRYTGSLAAMDIGQTNVPVAIVYDFPGIQLLFYPDRNTPYQGKLNRAATTMDFSGLSLRKTHAPETYTPLAPEDFSPRAGSVLQGYWKGAIILAKGNYPGGLGDLQRGNNWNGNPMDASNSLPIDLKIAEDADGTFRAELDSPMQGAVGQPASMAVNEGTIKLTLKDNAGMFRGAIDGSGQVLSGSWIQGGQSTPAFFKQANYGADLVQQDEEDFSSTSPSDLQGHWKGAWGFTIGQKTVTIPMELDIAKMPNGTYSAAMANLEQLGNEAPVVATSFEYSPPNLNAEWKWEDGSYSGQLDNGQLVGTWQEGGGKFQLVFERTKD